MTGLKLVARSWRVLVDEALPPEELAAIRAAIQDFAGGDVVGYHQLRTRRAGARRYVDLHVQFRAGTTLEDAHAIAHDLQDRIAAVLRGADVLIHLEPEDKVREDPIGDALAAPPRLSAAAPPNVNGGWGGERLRRCPAHRRPDLPSRTWIPPQRLSPSISATARGRSGRAAAPSPPHPAAVDVRPALRC